MITRKQFMEFFRNDECLSSLTVDDRHEIFAQIMLGSSDFTKELLEQIFNDYGVDRLEIIDWDETTRLVNHGEASP